MRDHKSSEKMSNGQSRRQHTYHKEMDYAFTLIFHNIKRLQDDRICNSAPNIAQPQYDQQESINPAMTLKVPFAQPKRCMSDSSLKLAVEDTQHHLKGLESRAKSRSFNGIETSPMQRRKVRFADDHEMKDRRVDGQRKSLTKRVFSDLQPRIVVTKEADSEK